MVKNLGIISVFLMTKSKVLKEFGPEKKRDS